jgi:hypothetical protein
MLGFVPRTCVNFALMASFCVGAAWVALDATPTHEPVAVPDARESSTKLTGLWTRYERSAEGDPIRFWYFHGDGKGLYRYGRVGYNATNSFDYRVVDGGVELYFRKTGKRHLSKFAIEADGEGAQWLSFAADPKEPGARYRKARGGMDDDGHSSSSSGGPGGRIWIDHRNFATGGNGFRMYQLNDAAIDGRGIGWYHEGDFDDWTTESLTYRIDADHLELYFDLREEPTLTHFQLTTDDEQRRWLELQEDPRGFGAESQFLDGGKSFGSAHAWHAVTGFKHASR